MSSEGHKYNCPFCEGKLQEGFVWKHHGGQIMVGGADFKWFDGPSRKPNHSDYSLSLGEAGLMASTISGSRCDQCRKIILDY